MTSIIHEVLFGINERDGIDCSVSETIRHENSQSPSLVSRCGPAARTLDAQGACKNDFVRHRGPIMKRLDDMALFVEVVKAHSFRRAAEIAGMSSSTLSRRVGELERTVSLRLIHRTTRRFELTEAGRLYYERCLHVIEEADLANEQLRGMLEKPSGLLRISLPVDFSVVYMSQLIADFSRACPDIRFELDLTPRCADLISESLDLAVRMGEQPASGLIARKIADIRRYLYASNGYLSKAGMPAHPRELSKHECLRMNTPQEGRGWTLRDGSAIHQTPVAGRFSANNMGMLQKLALQDLGIATLSKAMVKDDVDQGRLVRVLSPWEASPVPVFAVTATRLLPAKTQRFIEYLREALVET